MKRPLAAMHVVFDTNVYRGIGTARLTALLPQERDQHVIPLASFWPCVELLHHATDPADDAHGRALAGIRRLFEHTGYVHDDGRRLVRMHLDNESLLMRGLFHLEDVNRLERHGRVAELVRDIVLVGREHITAQDLAALGEVSQVVTQREEFFVASMRDVARIPGDTASRPEFGCTVGEARTQLIAHLMADPSLTLVAETRVRESARQAGIAAPEGELLSAMAVQVVASFPTAMMFFRRLIHRALEAPDLDWTRTAERNSIWDLQLTFHASRGGITDGVPVILITDDGAIHDAAEEANESLRVMRLAEYEQLLQTCGVSERAATIR